MLDRITIGWLEEQAACDEEVALFEKTFGESAALTRANLLKAAVAGLDLDWLAGEILEEPAWRAYEKAAVPAWTAYQAAKKPTKLALEEAEAATGKAVREAESSGDSDAGLKAFLAGREACTAAGQAYEAAEAAAWRDFLAVVAPRLADILGLP